METKANYVLIGVFTLLVIAAGLGFFLWLAKVQIDRTYTQYDVVFDQVAGLAQSSAVTFNGVNVGKVLTITLNRVDPSKVRVRIEVSATTPVRRGTEATLASQGVTGVAFVGLEGGGADAPRLAVDEVSGVAEIPTKPTVVQGLLETAPDLLDKAISVLNDIGRFTTQENADHVASIVANLDQASGRINKAVDDLTRTSDSFARAADQISAFAGQLDDLAQTADGTLVDASKAMKDVAASANAALADARAALNSVDRFATDGLPQISALGRDAQGVMGDISRLFRQIERDPARFLLGNSTPEYTR